MLIYTVRPGDTVYRIARNNSISPDSIITYNNLENPDRLAVGQSLIIPTEETYHQVERGESLFSIAAQYKVSMQDILEKNPQITNPSWILAGQTILIPAESTSKRSIDVNGFAFSSVSASTLQNTLPYLTYLSIFSYRVTPDSELSAVNDAPLISAARRANTAPVLALTNMRQEGGFGSELARTILQSETLQNKILDQVVATLQRKNYYGLNFDFEYIPEDLRQQYTAFIQKTVSRLRPMGYYVSIALAPKISANQAGLLYTAHDYAALGRLVDRVILMTYEWGYTYGPPEAVSPINQVERVLAYAVSVIPSGKILMGMPNYGYDWTLPYAQGSAARSLNFNSALNLAIRVGSEIQYDTQVQAPFFRYYESGKEHVVWFDDARSIQARLKLVEKHHLAGVSYWTIEPFYKPNWVILSSMYNINRVLPL